MPFKYADRVRETSTSVGTGPFSLAGAVSSFISFSAGIGANNTCYYAIVHRSADEWEVGYGTLDGTAANLTRTTVLASSNSNLAVTFSAGVKDVFNTFPALPISAFNTPNANGTALQAFSLAPYGTASGNTAELRLYELLANGNNYVGFKAPDTIGYNQVWTLPSADGTSGQIISTDGSGNLSWVTSLVSGAIGSGLLANNSVLSGAVASGQIGITHLASGTVNNFFTSGFIISGMVGNEAVTSGNIASGAVGQYAIASGSITAEHIASGAVINADVADNAITSGKIASGAIGSIHISSAGILSGNIASGQIGLYHLASGTILSGTFLLSGNVTSGYLGNGSVNSGSIAPGTINGVHIASGGLLSGSIGSGAIGSVHLADGAVLSGNISSGQIGLYHIASGVIQSGIFVVSGSVQSGALGNASVVSGSIASGSIGANHLASGAVASQLTSGVILSGVLGYGAVASGNVASGVLFTLTSGVISSGYIGNASVTSGNIASGSVSQFAIASGSITAEHIASGAVINSDIADNAVTSGKIASGSIGTIHIRDAGVLSGNIASGQIGVNHLSSGVVNNFFTSGFITSGMVGDASIVRGSIASGSIGQYQLSSGAINSGHIAANSVFNNIIASGGVQSGKLADNSVVSGSIASGQIDTNHFGSGAIINNALTLNGVPADRLNEQLNTGLLYGGILGFISGTTNIYISSGRGIITVPRGNTSGLPQITNVTWGLQSGVAVPVSSGVISYVTMKSGGVVNVQTATPTQDQYNSQIYLGFVLHQNKTNIYETHTHADVSYSLSEQMQTFARAFGNIKITGLSLSANGANLYVDRSSGATFAIGANYETDINNPSYTNESAQSQAVIYYIYRSASPGQYTFAASSATFDPSKYDDGTGTPATVPGGKYTIQKVFYIPQNTAHIYIYYGRAQYGSIAAASQNIFLEQFDESPFTQFGAVFLGYIITNGSASQLNNANDALFIQAGNFRNTAGGGGVTTQSLTDLSNVSITSGQNGQALIYDTGIWYNRFITSGSIASGQIGTYHIAQNAITDGLIASGAITSGMIGANAVFNNTIASGGVQSGKLADGAVYNNIVASGGVGSGKLANGTVLSGTIASGQIGTFHIAQNAITDGLIASGAITSGMVGNNAIFNNNIASGGIVSGKLANEVVVSGSIASGQVGLVHLASGTILSGTFVTSGSVQSGAIGNAAVVSGSIASGSVGQFAIASGSITAEHIASGAIINSDIADSAVTSGKIASGTIGTIHIRDAGILSGNIGSGQIDSIHLADGAVKSGDISSGQIGAYHLSSGVVYSFFTSGFITSGMIGNTAIVSGSVASGAIGTNHLSSGTLFTLTNPAANRVVTSLASGTNSATANGNFTYDGNSLNVGLISGISTFVVASGGYVKIQSSLFSGQNSTFDAYTIPTTDGVAAFYDYYAFNSTNGAYRAGNLVTAWNTLSGIIVFNETSTDDLGGTTTDLQWSTILQSGNVVLRSTLTGGTWNVKVGARVL